jgi:flagellar FliJ protein
MKKFKFKLEPVLKYKKILKDKQLAQFGQAQSAYREVEQDIENIKTAQKDTQQLMIDQAQTGFDLLSHETKELYINKLNTDLHREKVRLAKRRQRLELEQKKLIHIAKDEKGIEILKEKAVEEFKSELLYEQIKEIDDLISSRFRVES